MGASVDIEWSALDADLTRSVVTALSEAFSSAPRPSYIGEIQVTSFSFGDVVPEVELVDVCDIYKEFFEVPDDDIDEPAHASPAAHDEAGIVARSLRASTPLHDDSQQDDPFDRSDILNNDLSSQPEGTQTDATSPSSTYAPSLQLHVRVAYDGNMTIGLSTSLLVNYPTPRFMSLPLKLTVVSLAFRGTVVVAYEGSRRRIHLSILDPKQEMINGSLAYASLIGNHANGNTDPNASTTSSIVLPPTPGARLLQDAIVETEVGQADRHVLRNVGKVEKFVVDLVRTTLQSELVFPNFQTILY